ncbi:hypothetical protein EI94DRAFT_1719211 [Lactarius quietus]|nr:hypothetical protein EI94DRAFT_1719211 [Lactarius quietus]
MLINKREPESPRCTTVCWADFVVLSLVLLVVVYVFMGVPLTARLCKMLKGRRYGSSRPSSTSSSIHHTQRGYSMSPRRPGSDDTLLDGLVDVGNDKVDGSLSFFCLRDTANAQLLTIQDALLLDPFLVVQPSLNDSMLVKQGLVVETALPPPVHSAHDIQVGTLFRALPY